MTALDEIVADFRASQLAVASLPPTDLKSALLRALQADRACSQALSCETSERVITDAENDRIEAREALYDAFERHGIDRGLAGKLGDLL